MKKPIILTIIFIMITLIFSYFYFESHKNEKYHLYNVYINVPLLKSEISSGENLLSKLDEYKKEMRKSIEKNIEVKHITTFEGHEVARINVETQRKNVKFLRKIKYVTEVIESQDNF